VTRTWTATDACGNSSTATQTINVQDITAPVIATLPTISTISCPASPVFAVATAVDVCGSPFTLTYADVNMPGIDAGSYSLTRTWTAIDACGNVSSAFQTINVADTPTIASSVCTDHSTPASLDLITLLPANTPTGGTWTVGSANPPQNILSGSTFIYSNVPVTVTQDISVTFIYQTAGNCPITITVPVEYCVVLPASDCKILVHNAFSPDGVNPTFVIDNIGDRSCIFTNTVEIYNRWGILVYETDQYDNTTRVFRGISEGRVTVDKSSALPTGTYFYIIKYSNKEGDQHQEGYLYLTR
jgi:hypothetical protein